MNLTRRGRKLWWAAALPLAVGLLLIVISCKEKTVPTSPTDPAKGEDWFKEVTADSGIAFTYSNGQNVPALTLDGKPVVNKKDPDKGQPVLDRDGKPIGHLAILESLGGGAGLIDFDRDGLYDVFLPGGGTYVGDNHRTIVGQPCKMYRNLGHFKFQDVTKEVGLDKIDFYTHGVAVADYNNDGWPDLLVTGWGRVALFRNDPVDPNDPSKGRKFTDVTKEARLNDDQWSTSAGFADFDGDGFVDLYVCHYVNWHFAATEKEELKSNPECTYDGHTRDVCPPKNFDALPHVVYRNMGNGTFKDVSKSAGLRMPRAEADYKPLQEAYAAEALASGRAEPEARRQLKDEFIKQILDGIKERLRKEGTKENEVQKKAEKEAQDEAEKKVNALPAKTIEEKTAQVAQQMAADICKRLRDADAGKEYGKGLGLVIVDVNGDGKPEVYVACDTVDNLLYVNRSKPGQILFEENGLGAGVARDDNGGPNGSMGTDAVDYDGTLRPSLWCVNYENEKHALYHNDCVGDRVVFRYTTSLAGISAIGQTYVGWGTQYVDFDHSGLQSLFVSNGHAIRWPTARTKRFQKPVLMQAYEGEKDKEGKRLVKYRDITRTNGGAYCEGEHCGRGAAFGDLDNDGRVDIVLAHLNEPTAVLKTVAGDGNHWVGFELERKGHRDLVGAKVVLEAGGKKQARFAKGGGSYASANDPRHVFGLGKGEKIDKVTVTWPDLTEQTWEGLAVDQYWHLVEGNKDARPARAAE
jgi:hypothetical protein